MLSLRAILKPRRSPWLLPRRAIFPTACVLVRFYAEGKTGKAGKAEAEEEKTEKRKKKKKKKKNNPSPLDRFFTSFTSFPYNPKLSIPESLKALLGHLDYKEDSREWEKIRKRYKDTLPEEVKTWFTGSDKDIHAWHRLCRALGVPPADTPAACADKIQDIHVNIVDLIEWGRSGEENGPVDLFASVKDLAKYTREKEKYYPKDAVVNDKGETNIVLRHLLRKILREY